MRVRDYFWLIYTILFALVLIGGITWKALAHDHYTHWTQPDTDESCCNNKDCRVVTPRWGKSGWEVKIKDEWETVPKNKYVYYPDPTGRAHLCEEWGHIFCFRPPEPGI